MKQESINIKVSGILLLRLKRLLTIIETSICISLPKLKNILNKETCHLLQFIQDRKAGLDGGFQAQAACDGHLYYCRQKHVTKSLQLHS